MLSLFDLFLVSLATWQAVEVWHHGSLFEDLRAYLEAKQQSKWFVVRFVSDLAACPFCLSLWVAAGTLAMQAFGLWPINAVLAISRLANVYNDLTAFRSRTPGHDSGA